MNKKFEIEQAARVEGDQANADALVLEMNARVAAETTINERIDYVDSKVVVESVIDEKIAAAVQPLETIASVDVIRGRIVQLESDSVTKSEQAATVAGLERAINVKADQEYVDTHLATKADALTVDQHVAGINGRLDVAEQVLAMKADVTYVDSELAAKSEQLTTAFNDAIESAVDAAVGEVLENHGEDFEGLRGLIEAYEAADETLHATINNAVKANADAIAAEAAVREQSDRDITAKVNEIDGIARAKADKVYVDGQMANKIDYSTFNSVVGTQGSMTGRVNMVEGSLNAIRSDVSTLTNKVGGDAINGTVTSNLKNINTALAKKAEKTEVTSAIEQAKQYADQLASGKADKVEVEAAVEQAKQYADAGLAEKVNHHDLVAHEADFAAFKAIYETQIAELVDEIKTLRGYIVELQGKVGIEQAIKPEPVVIEQVSEQNFVPNANDASKFNMTASSDIIINGGQLNSMAAADATKYTQYEFTTKAGSDIELNDVVINDSTLWVITD